MKKIEIIDFYADWCAPCRAMNPILEEIKSEYSVESHGVHLQKVNVDENREFSIQNSIRSIPTLLFMVEGKEVARMVGQVKKLDIERKIKEILE